MSCFCVTETWLTHNVSGGEFIPTGYKIFRCVRGYKGGEVLIVNLTQLVRDATHVKGNLLDLVRCNCPERVGYWTTGKPQTISY